MNGGLGSSRDYGEVGPDGKRRTIDAESGRPWLGVEFVCAGQYVRVYRNAEGTAYVARCPACGKSKTFAVGPGGTGERFFQVRC